jgi:pimeloyl-ACP methyl ester carboxylesterase
MPISLDAATLRDLAVDNRDLVYRLRRLSAVIGLPFADPPLELVVQEGCIEDVRPLATATTLRIEASEEFVAGFFTPERQPGSESMIAGMITGGLRVTGADAALSASYMGAFGQLMEVVRESVIGPQEISADDNYPFEASDNAVGRYVYVTVDGVKARVFYEQAGRGDIALLLQHTAGGDSRQYRHILADPELQKRFRMIAYDLPYHGRSLPPLGVRWWEQPYQPTKASLMKWVVAISDAIDLDRPIFMGCSLGGNLALDLAAHYRNKFRAFIALNGWYSTSAVKGASSDAFRDPHLHPDGYATLMLGLTAPDAPKPRREEVYWNFLSNAPGVHAGDSEYFMSPEHNLGNDGHLIDTAQTPVYLLCGEYDRATYSEEFGGPAAERNIPGLQYRVMKGLGHFAPIDDPMGFRREIFPVLDQILAHGST